MTQVLHKAGTRGLADYGWLHSQHSFSFGNYHNPERMGFGLLRVINDDIVKPALGFDTHPHENMEIISIPLCGSLRHQDSMGNQHIISAGEVQVMSAGTGVTHSEYNNSAEVDVNFLQIWVLPKERNIAPRYGQQRFEIADRKNRFQTLVSPEKRSMGIWINQLAWFSLASLNADASISYQKHSAENGVYCFVTDGQLAVAGQELDRRDGVGLTGGEQLQIVAHSQSELLCIEVPMQ